MKSLLGSDVKLCVIAAVFGLLRILMVFAHVTNPHVLGSLAAFAHLFIGGLIVLYTLSHRSRLIQAVGVLSVVEVACSVWSRI